MEPSRSLDEKTQKEMAYIGLLTHEGVFASGWKPQFSESLETRTEQCVSTF